MSNLLFLCELPTTKGPASAEPTKLLLRVYFNPETESHLVAESVIFTLLSERQLGPQLFGIFSGGRLEEYIIVSLCGYSMEGKHWIRGNDVFSRVGPLPIPN